MFPRPGQAEFSYQIVDGYPVTQLRGTAHGIVALTRARARIVFASDDQSVTVWATGADGLGAVGAVEGS